MFSKTAAVLLAANRICGPLVLCLALWMAVPAAQAAGLAEDHTILYYLVEMQRRQTRNCNGQTMPEGPSLLPSQTLRQAAQEIAGGKPLYQALAAAGLDQNRVFLAESGDAAPRQAFEDFKARYCPSLMGTAFQYVGAARENGRWVLILSPDQGGSTPPSQSAAGEAPYTPAAPAPGGVYASSQPFPSGPAVQPPPAPREGVVPLMAPVPPTLPPAPTQYGALPQGAQPYGGSIPPVASAPRPAIPEEPLPDIGHKASSGMGGSTVLPGESISEHPPTLPGESGVQAPPLAAENGGPYTGGPISPSEYPAAPARPSADIVYTPLPSAKGPPGGYEPGQLLELVNLVRTKGQMCGGTVLPPAPPLKPNSALFAVAGKHAQDMAAKGYFSSTTPTGGTLGQRLSAAGYPWLEVAENLAQSPPPPDGAVQSWLDKDNLCKNLMNPIFTEAGAGYAPGKNYYILILAKPATDAREGTPQP